MLFLLSNHGLTILLQMLCLYTTYLSTLLGGTGVLLAAVFIRSSVAYTIVNVCPYAEGLCIDVGSGKLRFILGYIPNGKDKSSITNMCNFFKSSISREAANTIIGDFNMSTIDWERACAGSAVQQEFLDCISNLGLNQLVTEPTRETSFLDLVLVDNERAIYNVTVQDHFSNSDHCMVSFTGQLPSSLKGTPTTSDPKNGLKKINFELLRSYLEEIDWSDVFCNSPCVETKWTVFLEVMQTAVNYCSSILPTRSNGKKCPHSLRKLLTRKRKLWRIFKQNPSPSNKATYNAARSDYSTSVKQMAVQAELKVIKEGNPAALYRYVSKKTGGAKPIPPLNSDNGTLISDLDKANAFVAAFSNNFTIDNDILPETTPEVCNLLACEDAIFTPLKIFNTLGTFKNSRSVDTDGYSVSFYKEIGKQISEPLSNIFKLSYDTGTIPDNWKKARVVPIYKKGNAADPGNYRPISLTSIACKIMEKIIREVMMDFTMANNLLGSDQFGFLPNKSTMLQLLLCVDDWTQAMEAGQPTDVILIDYAKAFDSVVHNKLLAKLSWFGFNRSILEWIRDFLSGRTQFVKIGQSISVEKKVVSGVPQGSVLGPLLFILYINDLNCLIAILRKFADDVKMYRSISSAIDHQNLLSAALQLEKWSDNWQLSVAGNKCSVFHVGRNNNSLEYILGSGALKHIYEVKDLGVWFTSDLKVALHCSNIVKTARQRAAMIRRSFVSGDVGTLVWAFKVFVRPLLEYASPVWSPHLVKDVDLVESVQRHFTKYLPGMRNKSYNQRLHLLKLDSLEARRLKADLNLTYSLLHGLVDTDFRRFLIFVAVRGPEVISLNFL